MSEEKKLTPGHAAHDAWCADDDWDELDDETRDLWEETAEAGHALFADPGLAAENRKLRDTALELLGEFKHTAGGNWSALVTGEHYARLQARL